MQQVDVGTQFIAPEIRNDFPILARQVHGKPLVYLDSTASSQKPRAVIDAMSNYYETIHANVHRGVYEISEEATAAMEKARVKIARFLNARQSKQVIFTRNTTESINLVAYSWGAANISRGRSDHPDRDGASQQSGPLAVARPAHGRTSGVHARHR